MTLDVLYSSYGWTLGVLGRVWGMERGKSAFSARNWSNLGNGERYGESYY